MVPALPPELHALILENAAPFVYQHMHYQERQATLRACCLVSKLFLSLARPLLWQVVRCYTLPEVERFQDEAACERGGNTRYTRMLTSEILGDGDWDDGHGDDEDERIEVEADDVLQACRCFSQLRRLSLYSFSYEDPFDLSLLAQCAPKLQRLLLSSSFLQLSTSTASSSPSLRTLFLPDNHSPDNLAPLNTLDPDARRARDALLALCAQRNIDIRWCPEEGAHPEEAEPFVLRQFVLFARERTRGGAAQ
ncbi:hypothetical protein JCM10450v2_008338 [Rhodotorula kratochvilovae]